MYLYFGGAYNGKLKYIKKEYVIKEEEIFYCKKFDIDFSKKVICGLHKFIYENTINGKSSIEYILKNIEKFNNKIIICDELSQGIVPYKKQDRVFREELGSVLQILTERSKEVYRIFFGISIKLK